jgi:hypothetical protein
MKQSPFLVDTGYRLISIEILGIGWFEEERLEVLKRLGLLNLETLRATYGPGIVETHL